MTLEDHLLTEARNPRSENLDTLTALEIVELMDSEDAWAVEAVKAESASIARAIDELTDRFRRGGRLIHVGAGTSGRLGVLDASECPPTYEKFRIRTRRILREFAGIADDKAAKLLARCARNLNQSSPKSSNRRGSNWPEWWAWRLESWGSNWVGSPWRWPGAFS